METQFRLLGIPVQVSILFFLTVVLLRPRSPSPQWVALTGLWVATAFVGVLLHEMGHAVAGRAFGQDPRIRLHALGGLTSWQARGQLSPGRRILISLAGPGVGIALGFLALVAGVVSGLAKDKGTLGTWLDYFVWVNLGWGLLNLVPMMPLDGGNVMASVLDAIAPGRGRQGARVISILMALGLAALAVAAGAIFAAALCALFIYTNYQGLRAEWPRKPSLPPQTPIQGAGG